MRAWAWTWSPLMAVGSAADPVQLRPEKVLVPHLRTSGVWRALGSSLSSERLGDRGASAGRSAHTSRYGPARPIPRYQDDTAGKHSTVQDSSSRPQLMSVRSCTEMSSNRNSLGMDGQAMRWTHCIQRVWSRPLQQKRAALIADGPVEGPTLAEQG